MEAKTLFGLINGKHRHYRWYRANGMHAFFYGKGRNYQEEETYLYFNQIEIPIKRPYYRVTSEEAFDAVFELLTEMVKSGYSGKTSVLRLVTRNGSINVFNPIKEIEIDGDLYLVEYHSRAQRFNIRRAHKYGDRKYTTRRWTTCVDKYEYAGEL